MAVRSAASRMLSSAVVLNESKLNYDKSLSFDVIGKLASLTNHDDTTPEQLVERSQGQEILITKEMPVPGSVIDLLPPSVRIICEAGTGYNNIDIDACKKKGITVCNIPTYSTEAMATMAVTLMLSLSCSLVAQQKRVWEGDRKGWASLGPLPHFELAGKTVGLIGGRGTIGSRITEIVTALGMKVLITSRSTDPCINPSVQVVDLQTLLQESDFVSIHCPLNDHTRGKIGREQIRQMKPTAYLINTARGAICKQDELIAELKAGTIAGAGLDVQEVEPPPLDSPFYSLAELPNVIITPHIGWQRLETRQRLIDEVAKNIEAFQAGKPTNVVNP